MKTKALWKKYWLLLLKLYVIALFASPFIQSALALSEIFEDYNSPQALSMGNAFTADASGYSANYYNPAGLALLSKKSLEVNIIDLEGNMGLNAIGLDATAGTLGIYRLNGPMQGHPGQYNFFNFTGIPSITGRGWSFSLLTDYQYAGQSDGTNLDVNAHEDISPTFGIARSFAGNVLKFGASVRGILRQEFKGLYSQSYLSSLNDSSMQGLFKEGWGVGGNLGLLITIPNKFLPTIGIAWDNAFNTYFHAAHVLNSQANGIPDDIPQSVNAAFSLHPYLSNHWKSIFAVEWKHMEMQNLPWREHFHFGIQLEDEKSLFLWAGVNQLYVTAGFGLRLKGGSLEIGTYGEEVGVPGTPEQDRRLFFRYTIGF